MKRYTKRVILSMIVGALLALIGTSCKHTAHGFGQDVEKAGEKIQEKTQ